MSCSIDETKPSNQVSFILYHKSSSSGRTQFMRCENGSVCAPYELPSLSEVIDDENFTTEVTIHPAPFVKSVAQWLNVSEDDIEINADFHEYVDVPDGPLSICLARFTIIDPPYTEAETVGAKFVALTEMLDAKPAELELLRRAYAVIM